MKNGGQIPWNAFPICETFKISRLMGRLHTKDVLEQPFKRPIIPFGSLVEHYPISAKDQARIHHFGKKVLPGLFLGYAVYGDMLVADIEELETMDASEIYSKRLNAKEVIFHRRNMENSYFPSRRWTNKFYWRRSGTENIHLDTGSPNSRRTSKGFSWRIRRVSTSTTSTHIRMPVKQEMTSGPCQETSYTAMTLNPESNFTRREKNRSLFH